MNRKGLIIGDPAANQLERPNATFFIGDPEAELPYIILGDETLSAKFQLDLRNVLFMAKIPLAGIQINFKNSPIGMNFKNANDDDFQLLSKLWRKVSP